jgi:putative copper resistance protein D
VTLLSALIRAVHFSALMIVFGGSAYLALIRKLQDARPRDSRLRIMFGVAAATALLTSAFMLCLTAGQMSGDWRASYDPHLILSVLTATWYGHIFLIRLPVLAGLFVLSALAQRPRERSNTVFAGAALAMIGLTSHAAASGTGSSLLAANDALHLLCAGFWIGGLSVLALILFERKPGLLDALAVFSLWGTYAVFLLAIAGAINALAILQGPFVTWSHAYLTVLAIKIMLAAIMMALALANRFRLTPAIRAGEPDAAIVLRWSIQAELSLGTIIVFLASLLGLLPPIAPV